MSVWATVFEAAMSKKNQSLGRVELELLQYIDEHHPITVRDVAEYWNSKTGQARTTVLTMMERLTKKGFLTRKKIDNVFHYSPKQSAASVLRGMVGDFVQGVLGGSILPLAAYLTEEKQLSADQVAELRKLVEQLEDDGTKKEKRS
jgi:predicted transcriptional regulator